MRSISSLAQLSEALHDLLPSWDRGTVDSLAGSLAEAPRADIQGILENFLPPGDLAVRSAANAAINAFLKSKEAPSSSKQPTAQAGSSTGKMLGLFKEGGRIRTGGKSASGAPETRASIAPGPEEKTVCNCLGCGRIFDRRDTTNPDVIKFVESQGRCTFCGRQVALSRNTTLQPPDTAPQADTTAAGNTSNSSTAAVSKADAAAMAFKDRLVQYDRESAKRTQVIDDQSDYFEVENNMWLTAEERRQIRERRKLEEEAERARRHRVAVTVDLMGRRVLVADAATAVGASGASFRTGEDTVVASYDPKKADTSGTMWHVMPGDRGAQARGQEHEQGLAADGDVEASLRRAAEGMRQLRATACPDIGTAAPKYVRPPAASQAVQGREGVPHVAAAPSGAGPGLERVQDDLTEVFDEFETQVLDAELQAALVASESDAPFDLCPPEYQGLPAPPGSSYPRLVLLRNWLTTDAQQEILQLLRPLGMGPGGFYTPSYGYGRVMHLKMMCLGLHWEPRTHSYERVRGLDGATPPLIPARLKQLCAQAFQAASSQAHDQQGVTLPNLDPDICLVNFYNKSGRLGLHQDKDETSDSLQRGVPVVSFSIGDTADFVFSHTADESKAQVLRLHSGDVLVFGGPARMIYHGVPTIYPDTAPAPLLQVTGLRPGRVNMTFRQL